jgi:capsular exopolysaccharide synthesis family protein
MAVRTLYSGPGQGLGAYRAALPPPPGGGAGHEGLSLDQIRSVFRRHLSLILTVVVVGTALAVLIGSKLTPKYTATAAVVIDSTDARLLDVIDQARGAPENSMVETEIELITSSSLIGRVMADLKLFDDLEFRPPVAEGDRNVTIKLPEPLASVVAFLPESWLRAVGAAEDGLTPAEATDQANVAAATVERFMSQLEIEQAGGAVIDISATSRDAEKAARIANGIAEAYVNAQVERKRRAAGSAASWLADRLTELQHEVEAAEKQAAEFRASNGLFNSGGGGSTDGGTLNDQKILDLNRQLVALRADKRAHEAKLNRARASDPEALAEELNSSLIGTLRGEEATLLRQEAELAQTYGPRHPTMINLRAEIAGVRDKIRIEVERGVRSLADDLATLASQEQIIAQDLEELKQENAREGQAKVRLRELERQADANRQLYETFLRRYKEAQEQEQIIAPDARVITVAESPAKAITPGPKVFGLIGFTVSLMFGSLLAFLIDGLDRRVRSGAAIEREFGINVLGVLPLISGREARQRPAQYIAERPFSGFAEAARSIVTSLRMADQGAAASVLMVTSALPEEGKTTLSISLAAGAANAGLKVLLIDLDLRRPTLEERVAEAPVEGGLIDFLNGTLPRERLIQHEPKSGIDFIAVGPPPHNPLELLQSPKLSRLIEGARREYDQIIIDCAPILAVTDARVATRLADRIILATRWRHTGSDAVGGALRVLLGVRAEIAGCVLTAVNMNQYRLYASGEAASYYKRYRRYYID